MKISFRTKVVLHLDYNENSGKCIHDITELTLAMSDNLDRDQYIDKNGYPNVNGGNVMTNVLVQGLLLNIHKLHNDGMRDSAEHLRWIISELERGFIQVTETYNG